MPLSRNCGCTKGLGPGGRPAPDLRAGFQWVGAPVGARRVQEGSERHISPAADSQQPRSSCGIAVACREVPDAAIRANGRCRARTSDLLLVRQALSQLS